MNSQLRSNRRREQLMRLLTHLVVITIVFVLPEAIILNSDPHPRSIHWMPYLKMGVLVAVFYAEYFLMTPARTRLWRIAGSVIIVGSAFAILVILPRELNFHPRGPRGGDDLIMHPMVIRDLAMLLLTVGLSVAMRLSERMRNVEQAQRLEELSHLKSQLNPHFLFNSLNTVYALTEFDPAEARTAINNLSALLRYALYEAEAPTVTLRREIRFIADYVGLMRMRLGSTVNLTFETRIDPDMEDAGIAPMMFVNLVENAFKHGSKGNGAFVTITIEASPATGINMKTANSIDPAEPRASSGVGLANLRRRLTLIYGRDRFNLEVTRNNHTFVTNLHLVTLKTPPKK